MTVLQALAERVAAGEALRVEDARAVLAGHDLIAIGMMADGVRRQKHGARTTFVRVFEVHADAVPAAMPGGAEPGEVRLVGAPASVGAACAAVEAARRLAGDVPLTGFSLAHLDALGTADRSVWGALRQAGLDGVAELIAGDGAASLAALDRARAEELFVRRVTVHGPPHDPLGAVVEVQALQRAAGGLVAFAPLPRTMSVATPTTGFDDVKVVAAARLLLAELPSIQVDWPLYGPKLAQVALTMGADDVDGVAAVETGLLGPRRSALEEIRQNIRAAGLEAVERDGAFAVPDVPQVVGR